MSSPARTDLSLKIGATLLLAYGFNFFAFLATVVMSSAQQGGYGGDVVPPGWLSIWGYITVAPLILLCAYCIMSLVVHGIIWLVRVWKDQA